MPVCAVPTCATTHRAVDKTLYRFPKNAKYARIWVRCCMKKDSFNTKNAFICSSHFADEAYQRDISHDVLGYSSKKTLRKDAIPTLQLPSLRMFCENNVETEDSSLLVNVIPILSPKSFLKNIQFNFFNYSRINKNRTKFHHTNGKCCSNSAPPDNSPVTNLDLLSEDVCVDYKLTLDKNEHKSKQPKSES